MKPIEGPITEEERQTYAGRVECESRERDYCGSCPLEHHVVQMRDPKSWVHSSKDGWLQAYRDLIDPPEAWAMKLAERHVGTRQEDEEARITLAREFERVASTKEPQP